MERKIRILHIQETIASGGVEKTRLSLAKHLDKNVFEQKIICSQARGNLLDEIQAEEVEIISIGSLKHPFHWSKHKKVQKIINDYKPDIVHGAVFEGVTMAAINGWLKRVPSIIIEETSYPMNRSWRGNLLMKIFANMADVVVGVSTAVVSDYLIGKLKLSISKVQLINNGVAQPRAVSQEELEKTKSNWGIKLNDFVIGSVGRMLDDSNKRFSDLIKAFALFAKGKDNVKLLLLGQGPEQIKYKLLTEKLGVSDKVIFAGYQSDVTIFYCMMSVFSLVSLHESFGLVLAEAMLNRLPVVATKVGGMKNIVQDGKTGFLVSPSNVEQINEKIEYLYEDEELRVKMGEEGYEKAMKEYTEEVYAFNIKTLYKELYKKAK